MNGNDAWRAVAELAASQHGAFNREQAASNQIDAQRLRRAVDAGTIRKVLSDVFVFISTADSWLQRHMVASLAGGVISHGSAAALHGLDGFSRRGTGIDVCFTRGSERRIEGAAVHRWRYTSPSDITEVEGIACTSVARTLFQLGATCSAAQVEVALDSALRAGANPAWIEDTATRLVRPGPTGGRVLLDLMYDPARDGALSASVLEKVIERVLAEPRLPMAVRQHPVMIGGQQKRLDLAFPDVKLGIEGHSRTHHWGRIKEDADNLRDLQVAAQGWEVIYVTWHLAHQPQVLLDLVVEIYEQRHKLLSSAA